MECKYLNSYSLSGFQWSVASCIISDKPYSPSVSELHNYCNGNGHIKCPVLSVEGNTPGAGNPVNTSGCFE